MFSNGFIPQKLAECRVLNRQIFRDSIIAVLLMEIVRIFKAYILLPERQTIKSDNFCSTGEYTFTINAVCAPERRGPVCFTAPSIFIDISCSECKWLQALPLNIPFIKK